MSIGEINNEICGKKKMTEVEIISCVYYILHSNKNVVLQKKKKNKTTDSCDYAQPVIEVGGERIKWLELL
jgi:hypothetical protein